MSAAVAPAGPRRTVAPRRVLVTLGTCPGPRSGRWPLGGDAQAVVASVQEHWRQDRDGEQGRAWSVVRCPVVHVSPLLKIQKTHTDDV